MALRIKIPAGERIIVNGAVIRNDSNSQMSILIENRATVLRERQILLPEQVTTKLQEVYFHLQMMHIDEDNIDGHIAAFRRAAQHAFLLYNDPVIQATIFDAVGLVGDRQFHKALAAMKKYVKGPEAERAEQVLVSQMQEPAENSSG